jgi:hypothetical protein
MGYDPVWDMPQANWVQQGSFESGQIPPAVEPDAGTLVCLGPIAREWLYVVLGALDQLRNPSTWIVADDDAMYTTLRRVDKLREIIAVKEGCVPPVMLRLNAGCVLQYSNDGGATWIDTTDWAANFPGCVADNFPPPVPVNPPDNPPGQEACNIATWLGQQILAKAFTQRSADRTANNSVSASVANIISGVFGNTPFINFLTEAANYMVQTTDPETAADVAAAASDATFEHQVVLAIFGAIQPVGYVDASNFAAVATAIAAISYPAHAWAPIMIANFWTKLGLAVIRQIQSEGTVEGADCSAFDTPWCFKFDFTSNDGGWEEYEGPMSGFGTYTGGLGWVSQNSGALSTVAIGKQFPAGANITEVQVQFNSQSGHTSGQPHHACVQDPYQVTNVACDDLPFGVSYPGYTWDSCAPVGTGKAVVVQLTGAAAGLIDPVTIISAIQIRGTGVNPFGGFGPCTVGP